MLPLCGGLQAKVQGARPCCPVRGAGLCLCKLVPLFACCLRHILGKKGIDKVGVWVYNGIMGNDLPLSYGRE